MSLWLVFLNGYLLRKIIKWLNSLSVSQNIELKKFWIPSDRIREIIKNETTLLFLFLLIFFSPSARHYIILYNVFKRTLRYELHRFTFTLQTVLYFLAAMWLAKFILLPINSFILHTPRTVLDFISLFSPAILQFFFYLSSTSVVRFYFRTKYRKYLGILESHLKILLFNYSVSSIWGLYFRGNERKLNLWNFEYIKNKLTTSNYSSWTFFVSLPHQNCCKQMIICNYTTFRGHE